MGRADDPRRRRHQVPPSRWQNQDPPPQDRASSKKPKTSGALHSPSNFPPGFYDNLSKVWLTRRALRELDRRNEDRPPPKPIRRAKLLALAKLGVVTDFSQLRGVRLPSPSIASSGSRRTRAIKTTAVSSESIRSSPYDSNFEQHLIDHSIYPPLYDFPDGRRLPKPANWGEIRQVLKAPRGSLSPSVIPEPAFHDFQRKCKSRSEGAVMRNVVPLIAGNAGIPNEGHVPFTNLDSLTDNTTAVPVPDFFDGARPGDVEKRVREDLDRIIIPSEKAGVPVAPNFFLEAKGPGGTVEVADRQAIQDGAHGAIIMLTLDNYLREQPVYDGNAYAFSSTLIGGSLTMYAHHITAPARPGERPDHHTTQLMAYALTGDDGIWLEGTGAFRNLRKFAKDLRDRFIRRANARARRRNAEATARERNELASTLEEEHEGASPDDFFDCRMFAELGDDEQDAQETQETDVGLGIIPHAYGKDDSEDTEVPRGFATSSASESISQGVA